MLPRHRPSSASRRCPSPARAALVLLVVTTVAFAACGSARSEAPASPGATGSPNPAASAGSSGGTSGSPAPSSSAGASGGSSSSPGPSGPVATTSPADAAAYAAIEEQVQQLRGLKATQPVDPKLMDPSGLQAYIDKSLASVPSSQIEASDALLKALGLMPQSANLGDLFKELFTTQVAGFYDPETKELYVVSKQGGLGPVEKVTFAHEYTHALQDQTWPHFGGDEFQGASSGIIRTLDGNSDKSLGELALIEGDPTLVMTLWSQGHLSPMELLQLIAASSDPQTAQILDAMPPILRETLMYPYIQGIQFVLGRQAAGGWNAVDALYKDPPASTEQILHPEKYPTDTPVDVTLPTDIAAGMGSGWSRVIEDTMGELQLRVWLESAGGPAWKTTADTAAAGWGGDRVELVRGPNGAWALILKTVWDTERDAHEFTIAATATVGGSKLVGRVLPGSGGNEVDVVLGSDPQTMSRLANILGLAG